MTVRQISTSRDPSFCSVCERNLLRGEEHSAFLHGGERKIVCELCTQRATQLGWIRESGDMAPASGRIGWIRRSAARSPGGRRGRRGEVDESELLVPPEAQELVEHSGEDADYLDGQQTEPLEVVGRSEFDLPAKVELSVNERAVRAVPTHADRKGARAIEVFNVGEHPRTVATLARTLGAPVVSVRPSAKEGSIVSVVIAWELSWYGYEVDLADEGAGARLIDQGTELDQLDEVDRTPNAVADSRGMLHTAVEAQ
ncbi:MAG: hypothetical protein NTZ58_07880 [Solirubrobacterales bacterium]|nr:hypothetical protein [Solirubrobacterales bacterium]